MSEKVTDKKSETDYYEGKGKVTRTQEDVIEDEVKRRLAGALAEDGSGGVGRGRISLEVLYMLPTEFLRQYTELFDRALKEGVEGAGGAGTGNIDGGRVTDEKATSARNRAAGKRAGAGNRTDGRGGAKGGGKRYKTHWQIKDERALEVKALVDRRLKALIAEVWRAFGAAEKGGKMVPAEGNGNKVTCGVCGRGQARGWIQCPFHTNGDGPLGYN